jgi:hypothetical protein
MHRSSSMHTGLRSNRISIIPFSLLVSSFPSLQFQHMTIFRNPLTMETHFFDFHGMTQAEAEDLHPQSFRHKPTRKFLSCRDNSRGTNKRLLMFFFPNVVRLASRYPRLVFVPPKRFMENRYL